MSLQIIVLENSLHFQISLPVLQRGERDGTNYRSMNLSILRLPTVRNVLNRVENNILRVKGSVSVPVFYIFCILAK